MSFPSSKSDKHLVLEERLSIVCYIDIGDFDLICSPHRSLPLNILCSNQYQLLHIVNDYILIQHSDLEVRPETHDMPQIDGNILMFGNFQNIFRAVVTTSGRIEYHIGLVLNQ